MHHTRYFFDIGKINSLLWTRDKCEWLGLGSQKKSLGAHAHLEIKMITDQVSTPLSMILVSCTEAVKNN